MSHSATMFSLITPLRFAPPRLATPMTPMFSLSLGDNFRAQPCDAPKAAPAAPSAVCRMNLRRVITMLIYKYHLRPSLLARDFPHVHVFEIDLGLMGLEF